MVGLRVFTSRSTSESHDGCSIFYSRRNDGPFYRWSYFEDTHAWQAGRVLRSAIAPNELLMMAWKTIPEPLQRSMIDYYED